MRTFVLGCLLLLAAPAWSVFTAETISGFETGDLTEFSATVGTPTVVTAAAFTGERGLRGTGGDVATLLLANGTLTDGSPYIFGFRFRMSDATPSSNASLVGTQAGAGGLDVFFRINTSGTMQLVGAGGGTSGATTASDNTWYFIEVFVDPDDSGSAELFVDGVSDHTNSSDFNHTNDMQQIRMIGTSGQSHTSTIDIDDFYFFEDVTDASDRCSLSATRLCEVFWFSGGPASATPDTGNDLDTGNWDDLSQMPLNASVGAAYTGSTLSGDVDTNDVGTGSCTGGPNSCAAFDGTSIAANWMLYAERGSGGTTVHNQRYGNSTDTVTETAVVLGTSPAMFRQADAGSQMPSASEFCSIGISKDTGDRDYEPWEQWCYVLHLEPAAGTRRIFIVE